MGKIMKIGGWVLAAGTLAVAAGLYRTFAQGEPELFNVLMNGCQAIGENLTRTCGSRLDALDYAMKTNDMIAEGAVVTSAGAVVAIAGESVRMLAKYLEKGEK